MKPKTETVGGFLSQKTRHGVLFFLDADHSDAIELIAIASCALNDCHSRNLNIQSINVTSFFQNLVPCCSNHADFASEGQIPHRPSIHTPNGTLHKSTWKKNAPTWERMPWNLNRRLRQETWPSSLRYRNLQLCIAMRWQTAKCSQMRNSTPQ